MQRDSMPPHAPPEFPSAGVWLSDRPAARTLPRPAPKAPLVLLTALERRPLRLLRLLRLATIGDAMAGSDWPNGACSGCMSESSWLKSSRSRSRSLCSSSAAAAATRSWTMRSLLLRERSRAAHRPSLSARRTSRTVDASWMSCCNAAVAAVASSSLAGRSALPASSAPFARLPVRPPSVPSCPTPEGIIAPDVAAGANVALTGAARDRGCGNGCGDEDAVGEGCVARSSPRGRSSATLESSRSSRTA